MTDAEYFEQIHGLVAGNQIDVSCHKCNKPMRGPITGAAAGRNFVFVCLECKSARTYLSVLQVINEYWVDARTSDVRMSPALWKGLSTSARRYPLVKRVRIYLEMEGPDGA